MIRISPSLTIPDHLLEEHFVRSSGPGGQNVNKVSTSVELRFNLRAADVPDDVRARAEKLAGHKLTTEGVIVIHAHEHRTQKKNREAARDRLIELLTKAARRPRARKRTKPSAKAREYRLTAKHQRSDLKRRRTKRPAEDD